MRPFCPGAFLNRAAIVIITAPHIAIRKPFLSIIDDLPLVVFVYSPGLLQIALAYKTAVPFQNKHPLPVGCNTAVRYGYPALLLWCSPGRY
jgi:hypothetical protein